MLPKQPCHAVCMSRMVCVVPAGGGTVMQQSAPTQVLLDWTLADSQQQAVPSWSQFGFTLPTPGPARHMGSLP